MGLTYPCCKGKGHGATVDPIRRPSIKRGYPWLAMNDSLALTVLENRYLLAIDMGIKGGSLVRRFKVVIFSGDLGPSTSSDIPPLSS